MTRWYRHTIILTGKDEKAIQLQWANSLGLRLGYEYDIWLKTKSDYWRVPIKVTWVFRNRMDKLAFKLKFK